MTLINHETGELIESLSKDDARRLTDRIRLLSETIAETLDKLADLIDQARVGSAWLALGYRSWTEYVSVEFSSVLPRLGREPRQEFVKELASRGMSVRAIAPVVGAGKSTVERDMQVSHMGHVTETPAAPVAGSTPAQPEEPKVAPDERADTAAAAAGSDDSTATTRQGEKPATPRPAVVGIDGKTYSPRPPMPSAPAAQDARYMREALKVLASVASIHQFDPERVARTADDGDMQSIDAAFENFARWRQDVQSRRGRLHVIKGESR